MRIGASGWVVILVGPAVFLSIGGCPPQTTPGNPTGGDVPALTETEKDAISAAAQSSQSLRDALNTTKSSVDPGGGQSSFEAPLSATGGGALTFGTCPQVSMSASGASLSVKMTIDFGSSGCSPTESAGYTCSGSASGTFNQLTQSIALSFDTISCDGAALTGNIDVTYAINSLTLGLDGDWNLTYADSLGSVVTDGSGEAGYDGATLVTAISTFAGTVSDTVQTWNINISDVRVSYPTYESMIPFAGDVTVSGNTIRTLKIHFDLDSPLTGVVWVSIDNGACFEVNLYSL